MFIFATLSIVAAIGDWKMLKGGGSKKMMRQMQEMQRKGGGGMGGPGGGFGGFGGGMPRF